MQPLSNPASPAARIRVLVVDDSPFMRTALTRMIQSDPRLEVVDSASDGLEAVEKTERLDPDVVTMDIEMPRLDGLAALRRIMAAQPRPVIVVSSLTQAGAQATVEAFEVGAFDVMAKIGARGSMSILQIRDDLVAKIHAAAQARHRMRRHVAPAPPTPEAPPPLAQAASPLPSRLVAIGTSTGGPKILQVILAALPAELPVPLLIVQHMPPGFTAPFAQRLDTLCKIRVREAAEGDLLQPGSALIAPAGLHMTCTRDGNQVRARISKYPLDTLHRPSVDVMMRSVAEVYGQEAMGVILTGMGNDGEDGMRAINTAGGWTAGQDEESCAVYGMPRACAVAGLLKRQLPPAQIAGEIIRQTARR